MSIYTSRRSGWIHLNETLNLNQIFCKSSLLKVFRPEIILAQSLPLLQFFYLYFKGLCLSSYYLNCAVVAWSFFFRAGNFEFQTLGLHMVHTKGKFFDRLKIWFAMDSGSLKAHLGLNPAVGSAIKGSCCIPLKSREFHGGTGACTSGYPCRISALF